MARLRPSARDADRLTITSGEKISIEGEETYDAVDAIPEQLRKRTLAIRAFDKDGMMVERELVEGTDLEGAIERLLALPAAAYLHAHFAAPGCYAARIDRVTNDDVVAAATRLFVPDGCTLVLLGDVRKHAPDPRVFEALA